MAKRIFTANVVLNGGPDGITQFKVGDEVPEWAEVGKHVTQGVSRSSDAPTADEQGVDPAEGADGSDAGDDTSAEGADDEAGDYDDYSVEELKIEAKEREIKGYSKLNREQLIAALESDDAEEA